MQDDEALWTQAGHRNAALFESLYRRNFLRLRRFLGIYLGNPGVAEDVAQDTFLQLWERPHSFNPSRSPLKTYLFGIARKRAADWWRRQPPEDNSSADAALPESGASLLLHDALQQLDPELRQVLWLREVEGYSYEELARLLDIPVGTVKSRLFSAREKLRQVWNA